MCDNAFPRRPRFFALMWLCAALAACNTQPPAPPTLEPAAPELIEHTLSYLASDEMEGRGLGSAGIDAAANYIAGYFRGLGLQPPPGKKELFQPFEFSTVSGLSLKTSFKVGATSYRLDADFSAPSVTAEGALKGDVVFAGYGITARDPSGKLYDDYAGVNVKGKVAMVMRFEPHKPNGQSRMSNRDWSDNAAIPKKAKLAAQHGAVALIVVHPPVFHGDEAYFSPVRPFTRGTADRSPIPVIQVKQRVADDMLRLASAKSLETLEREIDDKFAPESFALSHVTAEGVVELAQQTFALKNVVACLPGKGWKKDEYIVVGAHYDHIGYGGFGSRAPTTRAVHHGADDNASGTTAVMELARIFSQADRRLGRSILFVAFSAEEEGLIGSRYFVNNPPVPLNKIVAMINLDMVGRLRNEQLLVGGVGLAAPFQRIVESAAEGTPLKLRESFGSGISPSDNASFIAKRIPALFFWTNLHEDYHRPSDTADKINYPGEARIVDVVAKTIAAIGRTPTEQLRFVEPPRPTTTRSTTMRAGGVSLGIIPDYADETAKGLRISGTSPGSPAAAAGLQANDVIVQIGDKKITSIYDLMDFLNTAPAGKPVRVHVERSGKTVVLTATPTARRAQ